MHHDLQDVLTYKGVWALCTTNKDGTQLKATHLAAVLIGGPSPLWGVFTIEKKFVRYAGSRAQIEAAYPTKVWRRKMATYHLIDWEHKSVETRSVELREVYGRELPRRGQDHE
jgi:hypothetical protein